MPKLFGVDIAGMVNQYLGPMVLDITLTRFTATTRDSANMTAGLRPTSADYTCKGFIEDYKDYQMMASVVRLGDRKVLILGSSITPSIVPQPSDQVTVESKTYNIVDVKRDPAAAVYECQVRLP